MLTDLAHIQINVRPENLDFYKDLMAFLGWETLYADDSMCGVGSAKGTSLWFAGAANESANDYDGPGVNHLGIGVEAQVDVDTVAAYLTEKGRTHLFETPRHRPDFAESETHTYYQVMFESPDRILFEVVYTGPLSKA